MGGTGAPGTVLGAILPLHKVCYRQGELGSLCSSDASALQRKRARGLGSKDCPSCKRSEAPLGYLQRSTGSSRAGSHSKPPTFCAKDFAAYCESKIGFIRA